MSNLSETNIRSLSEKEKVRLKPDIWLQSHDLNAVKHTVVEVVGNSLDEASMGFGKVIDITRYADHSLEVIDRGRGVPMDYNEKEGKYNWELIFTQLFAGGKYSGAEYDMSVGLNGVGLTVVQFASTYMEVESKRGGKTYKISFKKGDPVTELSITNSDNPSETGTRIRWLPDLEVFDEIEIDDNWFIPTIQGMALASGVTFNFKDEVTGETEVIGSKDYKEVLKDKTKEKVISDYLFTEGSGTTSDKRDGSDAYRYEYKIAFAFVQNGGEVRFFHNMVEVDKGSRGGIHSKSLFQGVGRGLSESLDKGLYLRDIYNLEGNLSAFIFTRSTSTSYDGQAKRTVLNKGLETVLTEVLSVEIGKIFQKNKEIRDYFKKVIDVHEKAQETAAKLKKQIKKAQEKIEEFDNSPIDKFVDCRSDYNRELYIVEGDSAMGSCRQARDSEFQAITSVRGKIKNCLKSDVTQILSNDIILRLIKIINENVELRGVGRVSFGDIREWEKFVICTDADEDGFQIRTLILAFFYRLYPTLLRQGRVYIAESPLFEIETSKESLFAYSNEEKDSIVESLNEKGVRHTVNRSKGLGENNPDMMWQTTMCPDTRRLVRVEYDEEQYEEMTAWVFDALLGDNLEERKTLIVDYMKNMNLAEVFS